MEGKMNIMLQGKPVPFSPGTPEAEALKTILPQRAPDVPEPDPVEPPTDWPDYVPKTNSLENFYHSPWARVKIG
jgi:hypothetical protein